LRTYDATFIFLTSMTEEAIDKTLARMEDEVNRLGGSVLKTQAQGRRAFARPMKKQDAGVYYKIQLGLEPETVDPLLGRFKLIDDIFRVQIVHGKVPEAAPEAEEETPAVAAPAAVETPAAAAPAAPEPAATTETAAPPPATAPGGDNGQS
jgi:ribosomal protein S6